jgi:hypothetical protein
MKIIGMFGAPDAGGSLIQDLFITNFGNSLFFKKRSNTKIDIDIIELILKQIGSEYYMTPNMLLPWVATFGWKGVLQLPITGALNYDRLRSSYSTLTDKSILFHCFQHSDMYDLCDFTLLCIRNPFSSWIVTQHRRWQSVNEYIEVYNNFHKAVTNNLASKKNIFKCKFEHLIVNSEPTIRHFANNAGLSFDGEFKSVTTPINKYFTKIDLKNFAMYHGLETPQEELDYITDNVIDHFGWIPKTRITMNDLLKDIKPEFQVEVDNIMNRNYITERREGCY